MEGGASQDGSGRNSGPSRRWSPRSVVSLSPSLSCRADFLGHGSSVVGTNNATKQLSKFLDCTKEYRAIGLLGCDTDSLDSDGKRVRTTAFDHVTQEKVKDVLAQFRGEIEQTPPM